MNPVKLFHNFGAIWQIGSLRPMRRKSLKSCIFPDDMTIGGTMVQIITQSNDEWNTSSFYRSNDHHTLCLNHLLSFTMEPRVLIDRWLITHRLIIPRNVSHGTYYQGSNAYMHNHVCLLLWSSLQSHARERPLSILLFTDRTHIVINCSRSTDGGLSSYMGGGETTLENPDAPLRLWTQQVGCCVWFLVNAT